MGSYHGKKSFETFSHAKSVFYNSTLIDNPLRYPPYSVKKLSWIKKLIGIASSTHKLFLRKSHFDMLFIEK